MNRFGNIGKATEENEKRIKDRLARLKERRDPDGIEVDNTLPPTEYPTLVKEEDESE